MPCPCPNCQPPAPPYNGPPAGAEPIGLWSWAYPYNSWNLRPGAQSFVEKQPCKPFSDYRDLPFSFQKFYALFPEFEGAEDYPQTLIASAAKQARFFVKPTWCRELDGPDRDYVLNLATAHFTVLLKKQQASLRGGSTPGMGAFAGADSGPGVVTSASVGGVSVTKTQLAQVKGYWEEFFYSTPYGRQMMVFLESCVAGGLYYEGAENPASWLRP